MLPCNRETDATAFDTVPPAGQTQRDVTVRVTLLFLLLALLLLLSRHTLATELASFEEQGRKCCVFLTEGARQAAKVI